MPGGGRAVHHIDLSVKRNTFAMVYLRTGLRTGKEIGHVSVVCTVLLMYFR